MSRKTICITLALCLIALVIASFSGCVGLPEKKNPSDTVGVMKVNRLFIHQSGEPIDKPSDYTPFHTYYLHVDDSPKGILVDQTDNHIYIKDLAPGPHMITYMTMRLLNSAEGRDDTRRVSIPFKLEAGKITILNVSWDYIIVVNGPNMYYINDRFNEMKSGEKQKLIDKLSASSTFKTWNVAD